MTVPAGLLDAIAAQARRDAPREVCGWLAGADGAVRDFYPVPNAARRPEREFLMEPQAQIDSLRRIREAGLTVLGTYHSHPKSPPVPSERDLSLALYPELLHLIFSVAVEEFGLWRITESARRRVALAPEAQDALGLREEKSRTRGASGDAKGRQGKLRGRRGGFSRRADPQT